MKREWRVIAGFPDYEVSNCGEVRSFRSRCDGVENPQLKAGKIMAGFVSEKGYHSVMLRREGDPKPVRQSVHRLVAKAFIPNPNNLSDVAHRDGKPSNNRKGNLRWSTHRDNQMDMRKHGTMQDGEKSCTAKITAETVEIIRAAVEVFGRGGQIRLARFFGLSVAQISRIKSGKRWAHLAEV